VFGQGFVSPFTNIYQGIACRDSKRLGQGLVGFELLLAGARLARALRARGGTATAEAPSAAAVLASFTGRIINHFTDEVGIKGITGVSAETLEVGQSTVVQRASFGFGSNDYLANAPGAGDIFVTDLPATASAGELNGIGVFGARMSYVISFGEGELFGQGIRIAWTMPSRGIGTIPGGTVVEGPIVVTRVR